MRTDITNCLTGSVRKRNLPISTFLSALCLTLTFLLNTQSFAQKPPPPPPTSPDDCKIGCTSSDVRILTAYLVDPVTLQKLDASFQCQGTATVKLALELATNTPRVGVTVYAKIKDFTGGTVGTTVFATPSECFGVALNQPSNKVVFQGSFGWPCGTPIVLTDVFLGWGTGNTNFCTGSAFQCPGTSSKCFSLPPGQYITIQIPNGQGASQTKCSTSPGGSTATFDLTASDNTVKNGQTNVTVRWYSDNAGTTELTGTGKTAFVNTTNPQTVYAKVCNNANLNVCSALQPVVLTVNPTPPAPVLSKVDNCDGTSTITAKDGANVIDGTQLSWTGTSQTGNPITVTTTAAITATWTVNGCPSAASTSITPAPKTTPNTPVLSKVDNCNGTSTITAKDGANVIDGTQLSWTGTSQTGNPITVTTTAAITVTWTVNGCTSAASNSITPAPKTTPNTPVLSKVDNCNGTSTITAKDGANVIDGTQLNWTGTSQTGNPITVTTTAAITATWTVNGCPSAASTSITPAPKTTPNTPVLSKVDNCNGTSTITAKDGANVIDGTQLSWTGTSQTGNPITVTTTAAITVTWTVNGCTSGTSNSITPAPKTTPNTPVLSKVDNCNGTSTITAKNGTTVIDGTQLAWTGTSQTGNPITVSTTAAITVTWTVNGCPSAASTPITPAPKTPPAAPILSKVDNCDGTTTITAKDASNNVLNASELNWSNSANTNPITVTTTATITATRTVNGCTSGNSNSITPVPGSTPAAPSVTYNAPACDQNTFSVTVTGVISGITYTIKDKNGANIIGVLPGNSVTAANTSNITFSNIPAGSGYQVTATLGNCTSSANSCGTVAGNTTTKVAEKTNLIVIGSSQLLVKAYPNPFTDRVKFVVNSPKAGNGSLEIYNMMGQKVKTIYQGHINAGDQSFDLSIPKKQQSTLIYIFKVDGKQTTGKLLQLNK